MSDLLDRAFVATFPALIKALPSVAGDSRRMVTVEASTEFEDYDGDVVLQKALVESAPSFIANGHLDIDHLSELGARMGIRDPSSYIVGRPTAVEPREGGRTFVTGEISRSLTGQVDVQANRYDEFWMSLQRDPPVQWFSSIYGFPLDLDDCTQGNCQSGGLKASRFVIKAIDWRSLAFTRTPKNTALKGAAHIVSAKSWMAELAKALPPTVEWPQTMDGVWAARACPNCEVHKAPSLLGYRRHYAACKGYPEGMADICAHAVMHKCAMERVHGR